MNIDSINKVCVVGWARSGVSLCKLLLSLKKEVFISELKPRQNFDAGGIDEFIKEGVKFEFGRHSDRFIKECDLVIVSPGVDTVNSMAMKIARNFNVLSVGEIEFASWLTKADFIAITGTNGKTTTTSLTYQLLERTGKRTFLGGNIGIPLSSFILETKKDDLIVLELSSFQLETIFEFRPYIAALLNIEPDHLDRYPVVEDYVKAKMNIFRNQKKGDWAVLNNNIDLHKIGRKIKSQVIRFSNEFPNENFSCVYRIGSICGLSREDCSRLFNAFSGLPHRMQFVKELNGIVFVNDSKATNPASTIWALKNTNTPVILIGGGRDKGLDFLPVRSYLKRVKKVILFGESAPKIQELFKTHVEIEMCGSLKESVDSSFQSAAAGDTVLFSPMCASFDMFSNYEDRGNKFIEIVETL